MTTKRQPNIVLCLCDQMRAQSVGCYGHPAIRTPAIDRMAARGPWFETACSNSPLCVPARSVLLTGQYARTCTGTSSNCVGFPPCRERVRCVDATLPEVLRGAGYTTALIGKWHVHPAPDLVGFDHALYPHNLHQHYGQTFFDEKGNCTRVEGFSLDYEMDHVRSYIAANRDRPFFLLYSLSPPHMPLNDAPEKYTRMYSRDDVALRDNVWVDGKLTHDRDWFRAYQWDYRGHLGLHDKAPYTFMPDDYDARRRLNPYLGIKEMIAQIRALMDDPVAGDAVRAKFPYLDPNAIPEDYDLRDLTALYYGMITCVDDRVNELMEALEANGIANDTIVVFTSDHGDNLGSHKLWMKDHLYEESIRIPLLYNWPGTLPSRRLGEQVGGLVDVMPTLLGLVGLDSPPTVQGRDFSAVLKGASEPRGENVAFIETYRHKAIGIRTRTHLYGIPMQGDIEAEWEPTPDTNQHLFFDLDSDPFQQRNLIPDSNDDPTAARLRNRLLKWHRETPRLRPGQVTGEGRSLTIY